MKYVAGQIKNLNLFALLLLSFILINVFASHSLAGPNRTTYQARIIKPDGYPLEASNVNFKFTILDPAGVCILFSETYSNVNMNSTGGMVSFALGSGVKSFPASATTFEQVFSNITPALSCDAGGPGIYNPSANDIRKIVMQFHDGNGWQTLPSMSINAVPYAMYANDAQKLNGKSDSDFVQISSLPQTCGASEAIRFNGSSFSCLAVGGTSNSVTSSTVTTALGYTPADEAGLTVVSSNLDAVSSTVASVSNLASSLQTSMAASFAAINNSQWITSGTTISYNQGSILVSGGVRISMDDANCDTVTAGLLRYNGGLVEFCNGSIWSAFGVAGAGVTNFNGSTSGSQTLAYSLTGTAPAFVSNNGVHTLNIPYASAGTTTAGLISNSDYSLFSTVISKITSSAASIAQALGYTPADQAVVTTLSSTISAVSSGVNSANANIATISAAVSSLQSSTAASFAAVTSSQWVSSGTAISYSLGHVGVTSLTATSAFTTPLIYGGTGAAGNLRLESTTNSTKGYILMAQGSSGGNVGIGQSMPLAKLYVDSDGLSPNSPLAGSVAVFDNESSDMNITLATAAHRKASIYFANTGLPTRGGISYQFDNTPSLDKLSIHVNSGSVVTLDALNRMGLGTSSPTSMLGIRNTSDIGSFNIKSFPGQGAYWMRVQDSNDNTQFLVHSNGGSNQLQLGLTNKVSMNADYGGIYEIPAGAIYGSNSNVSFFNTTGNPGLKVMTGYFNGSQFLSAWEIANVSSGFGQLALMRSGGNVGVGVAAPNAKLHIGSGTTTTAPLKIVSGSLLASPASGSIEYDGFNFYITDGTNTRRALASVANPGTFDNASNITSTGNITMTPTGSVIVSATTASTNTNTGALIVKGGLGVSGSLYSSSLNALTTAAGASNLATLETTGAGGRPYLLFRAESENKGYVGYGVGSSDELLLMNYKPASTSLGNNGNRTMTLTASGNVGVGLTVPTEQFTTTGNSLVGSGGYPAMYLRDTSWWVGILRQTETSWPDADSFVFNSPVGRPFVWTSGAVSRTEGTPLMYLDTTYGNLGVSTTAPLEKLDVNGNIIVRGANIYMVNDGAANANNDYITFDDGTINGSGGQYSFWSDTNRGNTGTGANAALSARAGYFNSHVAINSTAASHTLTVNGSMNAAGQVAETMTFAIDGTINGTWAIGSLSNSAATTHVEFEMQVHNNSTIDALRFQVSLPTYSNGAFYSGWQELPVAFGSTAWNGQKNYVIDVLRSSAVSGNPFYFRVRNKGGNGSSNTMRLRMTYNSENTFTRITHVNTVATAFNATTAAAGGPVDGMYGALEYSFPVATGQGWRPADNTGLFIKNSGYVGIGTSNPSVELEVSGTVKAQAYLYTSDRRLKEDIITLPDALEKALQLRGVNFVWKNSKEKTVGFIAQEVEAVYPELVKTDERTGYKAVQYGNIVAILVEALKEEHKQRVRSIASVEEKAETRMNQLEKENQDLKNRLERLEKLIIEKVK